MNQREKLIELLSEFYYQDVPPCSGCQHEMSAENPECEKCIIEHEADYLLEHGVVVLPRKVYKPWIFDGVNVDEYEVTDCVVELYTKCGSCRDIFNMDEIGKTVFLTKEEAERALAKRKDGDE